MKVIHIIGGGTFSHVRNHLAIAAPAFGTTARELHDLFRSHIAQMGENHISGDFKVELHLTKMADSQSKLVTNEDVAGLIDRLVKAKSTRCIIMNAALCDYKGSIQDDQYLGELDYEGHSPSGPHATRLKTSEGQKMMILDPAEKLVGNIRKTRKDIFVVAYKTTTGETSDEQYRIALNALKRDSVNLVVANDTVTRNNMIVAPEETRYCETSSRTELNTTLARIVMSRIQNTFTRSTVVEGETVPWQSNLVPDNLRKVVDHCIARGAYKPFRGSTAGHFAVKVNEGTILTSKRKRDYNDLDSVGLVRVDYDGDDKVIAHGAKPSVGGQSQRVVFAEHPEAECIVHFHSPMRNDARDALSHVDQAPNECGSHQCGAATSRGLKEFGDLKAVMLDGHGPNIVFSSQTPAEVVIDFIEANFDLQAKTGGLVA